MAQVKFAYGTKARYDALAPKDMDTLYFTTDTWQLFKGTTEYTKSTKMVSSLPAAGQVQGIIYFRMTDYTMHIWNGVEFVQLNKTTVTQIRQMLPTMIFRPQRLLPIMSTQRLPQWKVSKVNSLQTSLIMLVR